MFYAEKRFFFHYALYTKRSHVRQSPNIDPQELFLTYTPSKQLLRVYRWPNLEFERELLGKHP